MSLFKYITMDRTSILTDGLIRFSQFGALNDPFEMAPRYPALFIAEDDELRERWDYACQRFIDTHGILCLSESPDNALMWAHYADNHTGLVLEFDENHPFFDQRFSSSMPTRHLLQVMYQRNLPLLPFPLPYAEDLFAFWLTKTSDWAYEREWRMALPLDQAASVLEATPYSVHLFRLPLEAILGVILGARMPPSEKMRIVALIRSQPQLQHVTLYQATLDETTFSVVVRELLTNELDADGKDSSVQPAT